jgi:hypothetical protein
MDSGGNLIDSATVAAMVGEIANIGISFAPRKMDIKPLYKPYGNSVIISNNSLITLTEILKFNDTAGTPTNLLANLAMVGYYYRMVFSRGGATFQQRFVRGPYSETLVEGMNAGQMSFSQSAGADGSSFFSLT